MARIYPVLTVKRVHSCIGETWININLVIESLDTKSRPVLYNEQGVQHPGIENFQTVFDTVIQP